MAEPDYRTLEYRGPGLANPAWSLWWDPTLQSEVELHPTTVMRNDLTDRMREGIEARGTDPEPVAPPEAQEIPLVTFDEGDVDGPFTPVGGYDAEWRWDYITVDGEVIVAMDNRPLLDRLADELPTDERQHPTLQQAVIPLSLIRTIAASS